ncbi:MAG: hypothetical protein JST12_08855 [Armatimonadetes bacterium]|nr:hypothetical protein [Armatimonadota bacterium]
MVAGELMKQNPQPRKDSPSKLSLIKSEYIHFFSNLEVWLIQLYLLIKLIIALIASLLPAAEARAAQHDPVLGGTDKIPTAFAVDGSTPHR